MTREEAYRLVMRACEETWNEKTCKQIKEALEQEPCEDCISRKAVLNIVNERKFVHTMEYGEYIGEDSRQDELLYAGTVRNIVLALPSVEPTRPHGEWINEKWHETDLIGVTCSHCMVVESRFSDFCPNCGADMRGDNNGEF